MENQSLTFADLGLSHNVLSAIEQKGYTNPTPIQAATIPLLLKNEKDIIGQAQTGTGKTAAFALPLIDQLSEGGTLPQAIILTPTRELALQVAEEIVSFKGSKKLFVSTIYGGASMEKQLKELKKGVQIVVGTPGRVMDHLNRGSLRLDAITHIVLDEADEMLNMGFVEDIETILSHAPENRRMLLFSATMPAPIQEIARNYMGDYEKIAVKKEQITSADIDQIYYEVHDSDKLEALVRLMEIEKDFYGLVFCQTKIETDSVAAKLIEKGYHAEALHGDVSQFNREKILQKFKKKVINILVATDVAARGIDINNLTHVFNYSLPQDPESYVHRIGRTGRAGNKGTAISLVSPRDLRKLSYIRKVAKAEIRKAKLPGIKEIISSKIGHIREDLAEIILSGDFERFGPLADELLEAHDPAEIVSALLVYALGNDLDESNFRHIQEVKSDDKGGRDRGRNSRDDRRGDYRDDRRDDRRGGRREIKRNERLMIALGRMDQITPRKLVDFIQQNTGVPGKFIDDVRITDKCSYINVTSEDADKILTRLNKKSKGKRQMASKAGRD